MFGFSFRLESILANTQARLPGTAINIFFPLGNPAYVEVRALTVNSQDFKFLHFSLVTLRLLPDESRSRDSCFDRVAISECPAHRREIVTRKFHHPRRQKGWL